MRSKEFVQSDRKETINHFIAFCKDKLGLEKIPPIKFSNDTADTRENHRMGYFDPAEHHIWIYIGNRNMADILRTLCHELVHAKQREEDRIHDNAPDSDIEKEADMVAGQLMKQYGIINRNIYEDSNK
jgi:Zn-dependent peptidase ImmA (M78 family)